MNQLFEYRELIWELALKDIKLQYRRPVLGFLWMLIIPFSTAIVYKILFSDFMNVASCEYPFFIHLITALMPWNYFSSSVQRAAKCILDNKGIINHIPFPRYLIPISVVLANFINFLPSLLVLEGFLIGFNIGITGWIFFLPIIILLQTCLIIGLAFLVSALQVIYRDTEYIVQIMLMVLFFLTPAVYTLNELIDKTSPFFAKIYMLNPFVGILNLYRISFIQNYLKYLPIEVNLINTFINLFLWTIFILFIGYSVFKKYERRFCDYINR